MISLDGPSFRFEMGILHSTQKSGKSGEPNNLLVAFAIRIGKQAYVFRQCLWLEVKQPHISRPSQWKIARGFLIGPLAEADVDRLVKNLDFITTRARLPASILNSETPALNPTYANPL